MAQVLGICWAFQAQTEGELLKELKRFPDWQNRLSEYINSVAMHPFRPGTFDCMLFGAGAVQAQTGVDLAHGWGRYLSLTEGREMLKASGYSSHTDLVAELLPACPVLNARVGDIAILDGDLGQSVGVVQGHSIYVLQQGGIGVVPLTDAKRAFRV